MSKSKQALTYVFAIALCILAFAGAKFFGAPASSFVLAVIASSLYGGRRPAQLTALLSAFLFIFYVLPSGGHLLHSRTELLRLAVFVGAALVIVEIMESRRRSEQARWQIGQDFRSLAETSPDGILFIDPRGFILFANPIVGKFFDISLEEVVGKPVALLLPELRNGQSPQGEFSVRHKGGNVMTVEATYGQFGDKTTVFLRDISDRKQAQEKLAESEENLRLILDTIPGFVFARSHNGQVEYVNTRLAEYLGATPEEVLDGAWKNGFHPNEKESVLKMFEENFAIGEPFAMDYRRRRHDGVYRWFHTSVQPLKNRDGQVIRWYGLMTDIEDRLTMEESLRQTQVKLAQATQIATASELAAAIVHEISQPLSAIVANGQACLRWLEDTPPNVRDGCLAVERIVRDGNDAGAIIKGLRSLFGHAPLERSELNLRQIATEIIFLLRRKAERAGVAIELQMPHDLPLVLGDKIQLQQVLMNLITNGMESMQSVTHSSKRVILRAVQQEDQVLASVEDQGVGIGDFNKIFEAFFTTKKKGMGMGLAICRSIIEAHQGKLWGAPNISGGSVFSFTLPHLEGPIYA